MSEKKGKSPLTSQATPSSPSNCSLDHHCLLPALSSSQLSGKPTHKQKTWQSSVTRGGGMEEKQQLFCPPGKVATIETEPEAEGRLCLSEESEQPAIIKQLITLICKNK